MTTATYQPLQTLQPMPKRGAIPRLTSQTLLVQSIERGVIALDNGQYATMLKLDGLGMNILSQLEQSAAAQGLAETLMPMTSPFSLIAHVQPRNLDDAIADLADEARGETNPLMKKQYWAEQDFYGGLNEQFNLTQRDYYLAIRATDADRIAGESEGSDDDPRSVAQTFISRAMMVAGLAPDEAEMQRRAEKQAGYVRAHEARISPTLAEALRFRAQTYASGLSKMRMPARLMDSDEIVSVLGDLMGSPKRVYEAQHLDTRTRLGGAAWQETPRGLKIIGDAQQHVACLYVTTYPPRVPLGALFELIRMRDVTMTVALQVTPLDNTKIANQLRTREEVLITLAKTSNRQAGDVGRAQRMADLREVREKMESGEERLFRVGIRIAVRATSRSELNLAVRRVEAQMTGMGYGISRANRNQRRAFFACLPLGVDYLGQDKIAGRRTVHPTVTATNLACLFLNCIVDFTQDNGIVLGVSEADGSLILYNRWSKNIQSPHSFFVASTGGGKTVSIEIELLREMLLHPDLMCFAIDPQGFMAALADLVGGAKVDLGPEAGQCINVLDKYMITGKGTKLAALLDFLYPMLALMIRTDLAQSQRTAVGLAAKALYNHFEDGVSIMSMLRHSYRLNRRYTPIKDMLDDTQGQDGTRIPGIMSRLNTIYGEMHHHFHIPQSGLVRGHGVGENYRRPICYLDVTHNRWTYKGDGETNEPFAFAHARHLVGQASRSRIGVTPDEAAQLVTLLAQAFETSRRDAMVSLRSTTPAVKETFAPLRDDPTTSVTLKAGIGALMTVLDAQEKRLQPPAVWYPDPTWYFSLWDAFEARVREDGIFAALDAQAQPDAVRDAFVELKRGQPILSDLLPLLAAEGRLTAGALELVNNLGQFVDPDLYGTMFNGFTNVDLNSRFILFDTNQLGDNDLRTCRTFQTLNFIWARVRSQRKKYICVVDELGYQLESNFADVATFTQTLYMRGRAFGLSMVGVVQNLISLTGNRAATICLQNSGRKVLLHAEENAIPGLQREFSLSDGEANILMNAEEGESIQLISRKKAKTRLYVKYALSKAQLKAFDTRVKDEGGVVDDGKRRSRTYTVVDTASQQRARVAA